MALDLATSTPAAEGLCIAAFDPDPAVLGGDSEEIVASTIGAGGAYSIPGIDRKPAFGLIISVYDCVETDDTVFTSATPILPTDYADLPAGGELAGQTSFVINAAFRDGMQASMVAAGYGGDINKEGLMMGMVLDASLMPVDGATITGSATTVYYQDGDAKDGLYTTGASLNTETQAAGGALYAIPAAAISTYSADAAGLTFPTNTAGSSEGTALIVPMVAE
jgi:hypothetical protein